MDTHHSDPTSTSPDATDDARFMRRAIALAQLGARTPGAAPTGCVIVRDGEIIGEGHNEVGIQHDPTAHAEMVAIRRATARIGPDLRGCTLYATLQPCGMCSMASIWSKIGRIVYSAGRESVHRMYFEDRHLDTMDFIRDAFRDDLSVQGGVLTADSLPLYHKPDDIVPPEEQGNL